MPNLRILHMGMGWPVAAIVPTRAFPNGHAGHLKLKAVEEVDLACTHGEDLPEATTDPVECVVQNQKLRVQITDLQARIATLMEEAGDLREANRKLAVELAAHAELLESATADKLEAEATAFNAVNKD